jgi:LMBR1 domain-containing protein 1
MADWFLILATCISFVLLLVASLYFLVQYQHPDDRNEAWFPKLTVLLGLVLAGATVLLLPLDVANNEGYAGCIGYDTQFCGGLDMVLFWEIFFWTIPAFVFLLIPFMTFYYEADDGMLMEGTTVGGQRNSRLCEAIKWELAVVIVSGGLFLVGYLLAGESEVPIVAYSGTIPNFSFTTPDTGNSTFTTTSLASMTDGNANGNDDVNYSVSVEGSKSFEVISIQVNIPTFFAGFMSFFGWFFFAFFGGIGLAATPLDLILAWWNRPTHMDPSEFAEAQVLIRKRVNDLVNIGEMLKLDRDDSRSSEKKGMFGGWSKDARALRTTFLEFRKAVFLLEEDVEEFQACSANYENYNPLWPWLSLFFGLLSIILSTAWVAHIGVFIVPPTPIHPLLNSFFQWFEQWFPLFGVLSVAIFTLYLLLCAVKGCFKFGIRFLFFEIHPMKLNKTYMSSFMFNVGLILLCALPVVQFCVSAFSEYARYTNISQVMGTQVQNLKFFKWFWTSNIFVYVLLGVTGLTFFFLIFKPRDRTGMDSIGLKERLSGRKRA